MKLCANVWLSAAVFMSTVALIGCGNDQVAQGPVSADASGNQDISPGGNDTATDSGTQDGSTTGDVPVDTADSGGTDDSGSLDLGADGAADAADDAVMAPDSDTAGTGDASPDNGATDQDVAPTDDGLVDAVLADADAAGPDDATGATDEVAVADSADATASDDVGPVDAGPAPCVTAADCPVAPSCQIAACQAGVCAISAADDATACDDANACTAGDTCKAGVCVPGLVKNCDDNNPCTTDACAPATGLCANAPNALPCDDSNACTGADTCKDGQCIGSALSCDDKNPCTDDSCDTKTGCIGLANSAACDDKNACTTDDACKQKACAGTAADCNDGNACTTDSCDPAFGLCNFAAVPQGGACDDGNPCTDKDVCGGGKCKGSTKSCDDSNVCTDDSCDSKTGCLNLPNKVTCDDGSVCTTTDTCAGGKCTGAAKSCGDGNPCTDDGCDPKSGCTNLANTVTCSTGDVCQDAVCKDTKCTATGAPKSCDDKNPCTTDSCDAAKGCQNIALADATKCADGDACNNASLCKAGKCVTGAKVVCDDNNACTSDSCDPTKGCLFEPNNLPCDDGNACTLGDSCGLVGGKGALCIAGKNALNCDDNNPCTTDACDAKLGCSHANNTAPCDDNNVCTTPDLCKDGKCLPGPDTSCADSNVCTTDNCNPLNGKCLWSANTLPCDDGNACTTGDACANGGCTAGKLLDCNDNNLCTTDSCDAKTGKCVNSAAADGGACEDGSLCTTGDACSAGKCVGKANVNCDDANMCTDDVCDGKTGLCAHNNNTVACDDGSKCTTGDACAAGVCKAGTPAVCDDKNDCTVDSCDAIKGCVATNAADGASCDDKIACTAASTCKAGLCYPSAACSFLNDSFDCAAPAKGWTIVVPPGVPQNVQRKVQWAVDQTAAVGSNQEQAAHACTMNFNNSNNYCDVVQGGIGGQNQCMVPAGTSSSPVIDWTGVAATLGTHKLVFDSYLDVDLNDNAGIADAPQVILREVGTNAQIAQYYLPKTAQDLKAWKNGYTIDISAALGKKFTVEFSMYEPPNAVMPNAYTGDLGTGIYIDNVQVQVGFTAEVCNNGSDDDGNGLADCADPACAAVFPCNAKTLFSDSFDCADKAWTYTNSDGKVVWAVDSTPAAVKPVTGTCSLNYNNATDYNAVNGQNQSVANAGIATTSATFDATGLSVLQLSFSYYMDTEAPGGQGAGFDNGWLEVSTDGFNGCCAGAVNCGNGAQDCNTANTKSYALSRANLKTWVAFKQDIGAAFGGKKGIQLRFRFATVDQINNNYAGPFIDDLSLVGAP